MKSRGRGRTDANQKSLVKFMRRLGAAVFDTSGVGNGFPDLVVCFRGSNLLIEIKNPKTYHGRAGLSDHQQKFANEWMGGPIYIVKTADDVVRALLAADLNRPLDYQAAPDDYVAAVVKNIRGNLPELVKDAWKAEATAMRGQL